MKECGIYGECSKILPEKDVVAYKEISWVPKGIGLN